MMLLSRDGVRQSRLAKPVFTLLLITLCLTFNAKWAAGQGEPVRVGGDIKPPPKVKDVKPLYPPMARQARTQGVVILEVTIAEDGKVKAVKVLKSLALLEGAAIEAVKQWEFKPTLVNGKPVAIIMPVAVNFRLD